MKILDAYNSTIHNLAIKRGKMLLGQMNCTNFQLNHFDVNSTEKLIKVGMILLNELS